MPLRIRCIREVRSSIRGKPRNPHEDEISGNDLLLLSLLQILLCRRLIPSCDILDRRFEHGFLGHTPLLESHLMLL